MSEEATASTEPSSARRRSAICLKTKLEAVEFAMKTSVSSAARKFGVSRKQIQDWKSARARIEEASKAGPGASKRRRRLPGGGRKQRFHAVNIRVRDWILEKRRLRQLVSRRLIRLEAKRIAKEYPECSGFVASLGWLEKFLKRNGFSLRATTTTCQKLPVDSVTKIVEFILYVRKLRQEQNYDFSNIFACDETSVLLDPVGKKCVEKTGARDVTVQTLGHEKVHITVMLCAKADGRKCKPYVLLKRKRPIPAVAAKFSSLLVLSWAGKVWMDNPLTEDFLRRILGPLSFGKRMIICDSFRCHISNDTKAVLSELNTHQAVVPGGCTKYVQAPDVSWNKPFKASICRSHEDWMADGSGVEFTKGGNPRPPPMMTYLQWVVDAWASISSDLIRKSFKVCGITTNVDGSEDDLVYCFRPEGPIPEGLQELKARLAAVVGSPVLVPENTHNEDENNLVEVDVDNPIRSSDNDVEESESESDDGL